MAAPFDVACQQLLGLVCPEKVDDVCERASTMTVSSLVNLCSAPPPPAHDDACEEPKEPRAPRSPSLGSFGSTPQSALRSSHDVARLNRAGVTREMALWPEMAQAHVPH